MVKEYTKTQIIYIDENNLYKTLLFIQMPYDKAKDLAIKEYKINNDNIIDIQDVVLQYKVFESPITETNFINS